MSILDRLNLLIRSNLNDTLGRHGRPSARKALSEMESSLREARRRQAELRRDEKRLIQQIREERERADRWEDRAMLALRKDDEELAREALLVKNDAVRKARQLRDQLDDHRAHMQDIERALEALEHKLEGTRSKMRALSQERRKSSPPARRPTSGDRSGAEWDERLRQRSRSGAPSTTEPMDPALGESFDTSGTFREMDRMASKIDGMEAEIEAMRELSDIGGDGRREELERIFSSMEGRRRPRHDESGRRREDRRRDQPPLDDDLADLKKKFE